MHDTVRPAAWSVCSRHALRNTLLSVEILLGTKPGMHVLAKVKPLFKRLPAAAVLCMS